jgi:hypothetical protein
MQLDYTPPGTVVPFFTSTSFVSLVCGPIGSTKTTAALMKIAYHAKQMAACRDGVRRSRAIVVRNTREMLLDSTIPDFFKWFPAGAAGDWLKTERRFILRFDDVECEVLFRGLDDANDVRRLLSLQASFGVLDEYREINPSIFEALQGRLGRYPDGMMVPHRPEWGVDGKGNPIQGCVTDEGKSNAHLWGASNPPEYDSWWQEFLDNPPDNASVTFQPSGLAQEADWLHLLPPDYYPNLAEGKSEDWVDVYIHGQYGRSLSGKPVFPEFRQDYHVAKQPLRYIRSPEKPLMIGLDFGLSPAAAIGQLDVQGRLLLLAAVTSEGMGISRFVREKLKPLLVERFPGHPVVLIGDPAGSQRAQTDEKSCFDILKAEGFVVRPAKTNSIQARVSAVEKFLSRQVDTGPGFLVDPRCDALIRALRGGYRYKVKPKSGEIDMSPEKNHHSHIADALEYLCLHADGGTMFGPVLTSERKEIRKVSSGGWT